MCVILAFRLMRLQVKLHWTFISDYIGEIIDSICQCSGLSVARPYKKKGLI
jgi:uncharacterized membrane protein YpjA